MERETALHILLDSAFKNEISEDVNSQAMYLVENIPAAPAALQVYDGFVELTYDTGHDTIKYFISSNYVSANRHNFWTNFMSVDAAVEEYHNFLG